MDVIEASAQIPFEAEFRVRDSHAPDARSQDMLAHEPRIHVALMKEALTIVDQQHRRAKEWRETAQKLERELALETALAAGLLAQAKALKDALRIVHPDHILLRPTGRSFSDSGHSETTLTLVFNHAFDLRAKELGLDQPEQARAPAL
jgi:hypothetical protein